MKSAEEIKKRIKELQESQQKPQHQTLDTKRDILPLLSDLAEAVEELEKRSENRVADGGKQG